MTIDPNFNDGFPPDFAHDDIAIIREVEPYTVTGLERLVALIQAVRYIVTHDIEGDLVSAGSGEAAASWRWPESSCN
jgi:hypothetical protein